MIPIQPAGQRGAGVIKAFTAPGRIHLTSLPPLALYVHFPWCVRKCPYCDFNSHEWKGDAFPETEYLDALRTDLELALPLVWGRQVHTVFIGGGTPSLLSAAGLDRLLSDVRALLPLDAAADRFVRERLPALLRDDMLARIREHQALGNEVVLVSASPSLYLRKWAASAGIDTVLASELEWRDGAYTGRLAGRNCWGPEKSARLRAWWGERAPRTLYAYGDSRGDREMAALADHPWIRGTVPMPPMAHAAGGAM